MTDNQAAESPGSVILAAAQATGAPATIKTKIQQAVMRLIVGSVGPDRIEAVRANVSTVEGRSRIDAMVAEEIGRQAIADPAFMERAKARFLGSLASKQENIEAIATKAHTKSSSESDADQIASDDIGEPSQDWMNAFIRQAEDASSEDLRERLATVLAGEARRPGTFSRTTIRLIAELDRQILEQFQSILTHCVGSAIITEDSWSSGSLFATGVTLEDHGLISGSGGFTQRKIVFNKNGNGFFIGDRHAIVLQGKSPLEKQVPIWLLTRAGIEVASLLPHVDERAALRKIVTSIDKEGLTRIMLGQKIELGTGQFQVTHDEVVWQAEG